MIDNTEEKGVEELRRKVYKLEVTHWRWLRLCRAFIGRKKDETDAQFAQRAKDWSEAVISLALMAKEDG